MDVPGSRSAPTLHFMDGQGEMATLMRTKDWGSTRLGVPDSWPQSLKTVASVCLHSRFPMLLWWGPELVMLYNDAYRPILGQVKHPAALGQAGADCWPEIWSFIGPMLRTVLEAGQATWAADQLLVLERNGFLEECYFTFSYSPIHDEAGGIGGVFTAVTETTERVLQERRMNALRSLNDRLMDATSAEDVFSRAVDTLAADPLDFSFVACYCADEDTTRLGAVAGEPHFVTRLRGMSSHAIEVPLQTCIRQALREEQQQSFSSGDLSPQEWRDVVIAQPIVTTAASDSPACLVVGLNVQRTDDESFRTFVAMCAKYIAMALDTVHAHEVERRRMAALAELDRAKTAFFSNVSHELRTPLTLIQGPVETFVEQRPDDVDAQGMRIALRNLGRLRKLVNTLLDFSRIEAGRMKTDLEPTDLAAATADIASLFRSTIEAAGIDFRVECAPLSRAVMVDRDMWEKVVSNFLSNAFKYTTEGLIGVFLREVNGQIELRVSDTGVGIEPDDQRRVFDRFYRANAGMGRTEEGAGIGLALVKELVQLHGGEVKVESAPGVGSQFTVLLPTSSLFAGRGDSVRPWSTAAVLGLDEVSETEVASAVEIASHAVGRARLLVADDNADMRHYLGRILEPHWKVEFVSDGNAALESLRTHLPDLLLCDVMMPGLDGLELVRILRSDTATARLPVMMLSARAGDEARADGLAAGADDYLVKPFTARELVARIDNQLMRGRLADMERQVSARLTEVFAQAPVAIAVTRGPEHVYEFVNARYESLAPGRQFVGRSLAEIFPELAGQGIYEIFDEADRTGEPYVSRSHRVQLANATSGEMEDRYFDFVYQPLSNSDGASNGVAIVAYDVDALATAQRQAEAANRTKDEFIAMLGHELRNPLAPIVTALQLLRMRFGDTAAKERGIIERQVHHMVRLVDDLLDISRITRGNVQLKMEVVELWIVVTKAIETTTPLIEQKRHQLSVDIPTWGLRIDADTQRLCQVISNLLSNAARYTPEGGVISLRAGVENGRVALHVTDSGIGMTADELDSVFQIFVQGAQSIDRPQGGLGLGLAIAKSLTELHNGLLTASSAGQGKGSTFRMELPLVDGEAAVFPKAQSGVLAPSGSGRRVLIVDDNVDAAATLSDLLSAWGYEVVVAHDGPSALVTAQDVAPDIAVLDIGLPVMDGYELAAHLRLQNGGDRMKFIALTGFGQQADVERSSQNGFVDHLVKPVDVERLATVFK